MSVDAFEGAVAQHLRTIHDTAVASPAGGGPAWDQLLRHYGVPSSGDMARRVVVASMGLTRGASPAEVRALLEALVRWAEGELARLSGDPATAGDPRLSSWRQRLPTLARAEAERYELAVGLSRSAPAVAARPAAPALGAIFANAQKTSKEVPWAGMKYDQSRVLTCVHCGGPQEAPQDFICRYCRQPMAGKIEKTS